MIFRMTLTDRILFGILAIALSCLAVVIAGFGTEAPAPAGFIFIILGICCAALALLLGCMVVRGQFLE